MAPDLNQPADPSIGRCLSEDVRLKPHGLPARCSEAENVSPSYGCVCPNFLKHIDAAVASDYSAHLPNVIRLRGAIVSLAVHSLYEVGYQ